MIKYSFDKAFVTSFSTKFASFLFDFILLIFINLLLCFGSNEIEHRCWKKEVLEYIAEQENIVV